MRRWLMFYLVICFIGPLHVDSVSNVGKETIRPEESGTLCNKDPKLKCATNATCMPDGICKCLHGGDGSFNCYNKDDKSTEILHGQVFRTWNGFKFKVIWPCYFPVTAVHTEGSGQVSSCFTKLFAIYGIIGGHINLLGFDAFMQVKLLSGGVKTLAVRNIGVLDNHVYKFVEYGKIYVAHEGPSQNSTSYMDDEDGSGSGDGETFVYDDEDMDKEMQNKTTWGPPQILALPDGVTTQTIINSDNVAEMDASYCGFYIKYQPFNDHSGGLSMTLENWREHYPFFNDYRTQIAGNFYASNLEYTSTIWNISPEQALLYNVLDIEKDLHYDYDWPYASECSAASNVFKTYCNTGQKKARAITSCSSFLESDNLVYCLHGNQDFQHQSNVKKSSILKLFTQCLHYSCRPCSGSCNDFEEMMKVGSCQRYLPLQFYQLQCHKLYFSRH